MSPSSSIQNQKRTLGQTASLAHRVHRRHSGVSMPILVRQLEPPSPPIPIRHQTRLVFLFISTFPTPSTPYNVPQECSPGAEERHRDDDNGHKRHADDANSNYFPLCQLAWGCRGNIVVRRRNARDRWGGPATCARVRISTMTRFCVLSMLWEEGRQSGRSSRCSGVQACSRGDCLACCARMLVMRCDGSCLCLR
jgi:hypothetical protein